MCRKARKGFGIMGKTTRRKYDPKFKMRVALEVYKGEKTLSQVASENGIAPSLAAEWRDQLLDEGAADVFGKTQREREGKAREEAARREHDVNWLSSFDTDLLLLPKALA